MHTVPHPDTGPGSRGRTNSWFCVCWVPQTPWRRVFMFFCSVDARTAAVESEATAGLSGTGRWRQGRRHAPTTCCRRSRRSTPPSPTGPPSVRGTRASPACCTNHHVMDRLYQTQILWWGNSPAWCHVGGQSGINSRAAAPGRLGPFCCRGPASQPRGLLELAPQSESRSAPLPVDGVRSFVARIHHSQCTRWYMGS